MIASTYYCFFVYAYGDHRHLQLLKLSVPTRGSYVLPAPAGDDRMQVDLGIRIAPDAALAIVAPAQQLSRGAALSQERRAALLCWAEDENKWIIEDDNLSELQQIGRAHV